MLKSLKLFQKKLTSLTKSVSGGRNVLGRITAFHRGGRGRRKYRFVDFWRKVKSVGVILKVVHDPNRTAKLGLVFYYNGLLSYILLTQGLKIGSLINSNLDKFSIDGTDSITFNIGSVFSVKDLPLGTLVHSVELYPNMGAQLVRSAGTTALLYRKSNDFAYIKLKSGWNVVISKLASAVVGVVSNKKHITIPYKKAGVIRNLGFRPVVRGVAMNPIDHPHGGGQGRTSGGPQPLSPWGKLTKWRPTVSGALRRRKALYRFR